MPKIWECLSEESRPLWPALYEYFTEKEWDTPEKGKRAIQLEPKLESTEEISRQMREKPNYTVEKQERDR